MYTVNITYAFSIEEENESWSGIHIMLLAYLIAHPYAQVDLDECNVRRRLGTRQVLKHRFYHPARRAGLRSKESY
jgi:hypothetical protein